MNDIDYKEKEYRLKLVNTLFAILGAIGVIASIIIGFAQLNQATSAQTEAIEQQWNSSFYDERIRIYTRATEAAGEIASLVRMKESDTGNVPDDEINSAIVDFRKLFWGPMCITEGEDVSKAMVKFNEGLDRKVDARTLEQLALRLAHICKNETYAYYLGMDSAVSRLGSNDRILFQMEDWLDNF
jgi:hypothetical protein